MANAEDLRKKLLQSTATPTEESTKLTDKDKARNMSKEVGKWIDTLQINLEDLVGQENLDEIPDNDKNNPAKVVLEAQLKNWHAK